jgi:hypothetical protein
MADISYSKQSIAFAAAQLAYQQEFLASRNLAPRTRHEYLADIADLVDFLREPLGIASVH